MKKGFIIGLVALFTIFSMAMVSCDNGSSSTTKDTVVITIDLNGATLEGYTQGQQVTIDKGAKLSPFPGTPTKDDLTFTGWYNGSTKVDENTTFDANATIKALFEGEEPPPPPPPPPTGGLVEKVNLDNGFHVMYKFVLPAGKTWEDYQKITVDYQVDEEIFSKSNSARDHRLLGNYVNDDFSFFTLDGKGYAVAAYASSGGKETNKNAPYILDNPGNEWTSVEGLLEALDITAGPDEWFTIEHTIDGTTKHGSYDESNQPAASAAGPFYFAVGLAGNGEGGSTQLIRNVTLVGYPGVDDVIAVPLMFKDQNGVEYAAFAGWADSSGDNGVREATRAIEGTGSYIYEAIEVIIPPVVEEVNLDNGFHVVYKFALPDGAEWADYQKITVDYKVDEEIFSKSNSARDHRLLGNYVQSDFSFFTLDGKGYAVAAYASSGGKDTNKNAPYILDNPGNEWTSVEGLLEALDITAGPDEWFTIEHTIDGTTKHGSYDASNQPAASDTGPFYFAVGLAGNGEGGSTQQIRNVTLVGYPGVDDVIAVPLMFKDQNGVEYAAFAGWADSSGDNGVREATRTLVSGSYSYDSVISTDSMFALGMPYIENAGQEANQQGWGTDGVDGFESDLDMDTLSAAKYLVLATCPANLDGFGGLQFAYQGDGNSWGWTQESLIGGWLSFGHAEGDVLYVAIELAKVKPETWPSFAGGTQGKFFVCYYSDGGIVDGLGLTGAWLTDKNLAKPDGAADMGTFGFIYK